MAERLSLALVVAEMLRPELDVAGPPQGVDICRHRGCTCRARSLCRPAAPCVARCTGASSRGGLATGTVAGGGALDGTDTAHAVGVGHSALLSSKCGANGITSQVERGGAERGLPNPGGGPAPGAGGEAEPLGDVIGTLGGGLGVGFGDTGGAMTNGSPGSGSTWVALGGRASVAAMGYAPSAESIRCGLFAKTVSVARDASAPPTAMYPIHLDVPSCVLKCWRRCEPWPRQRPCA